MKLHQIRDVVAIVEHGSLRAAAQRLGLAQPALTRSIRELEHELGVPLFERHARGMKLSVMGHAFIRRARAVQAEIRHSQEEINQLKGLMTGQVSIGLSMASSIVFLPSLLKPLLKRFPGVRLKVSEGFYPDMRHKIIEGDVDFYVGPLLEKLQTRELLVEELIKGEGIVFGRVGHPLQGARSLAELASAHWVGMLIAATGVLEPRGIFKMHGLGEPNIEMETQSALSTIIIAAKSDLLTVLPRMCLRYPGVNKLLKQIKVEKIEAPTICLIRRASLPLTPAAEFLSDVIRRAATAEQIFFQ